MHPIRLAKVVQCSVFSFSILQTVAESKLEEKRGEMKSIVSNSAAEVTCSVCTSGIRSQKTLISTEAVIQQ